MIRVALLCAGLVVAGGSGGPPEGESAGAASPPRAADDAEHAAALAEYNARREKAKNTADAQWKLAVWCEQHGLRAESIAHLTAVVKLDPGRASAWHKLGFKKHNGRWMSDEQIREEAEQQKADRVWGPRLAKWHRQYHDLKARAEAELAKIDDPQTVPSIYRELVGGGAADQTLAIQLLGQIQGPKASKTLAVLAVYGKTPEVRRRATETLRHREPAEFVDLLIGFLKDVIKYEVRPVGGPGSPGVLLVEGQRFNIRRLYAPPPPPNVSFRPGDTIAYDQLGMPVILRRLPGGPAATGSLFVAGVSKPFTVELSSVVAISPTQNMIEAQKAARSAQQQLQSDIAQIDRFNEVRKSFNSLVLDVVKDSTGEDLGEDREAWTDWLAKRKEYAQEPPKATTRPTLNQLAALAYSPTYGRALFLLGPPVDH